jgi:hypothetical protein
MKIVFFNETIHIHLSYVTETISISCHLTQRILEVLVVFRVEREGTVDFSVERLGPLVDFMSSNSAGSTAGSAGSARSFGRLQTRKARSFGRLQTRKTRRFGRLQTRYGWTLCRLHR